MFSRILLTFSSWALACCMPLLGRENLPQSQNLLLRLSKLSLPFLPLTLLLLCAQTLHLNNFTIAHFVSAFFDWRVGIVPGNLHQSRYLLVKWCHRENPETKRIYYTGCSEKLKLQTGWELYFVAYISKSGWGRGWKSIWQNFSWLQMVWDVKISDGMCSSYCLIDPLKVQVLAQHSNILTQSLSA